jgi:2,4-dienoyl-CoA reductase-like NADH-dependent reductase (Old Yellow Enzyme family)
MQLFPETRGLPAKATPSGVATEALAGLSGAYARAARVCVEAGFDGVEVHGASPFILSQLASRRTNLRCDAYERLPQLACEIVRTLRAAVPQDILLLYRHTICEPEKYTEAAKFANELHGAGLDLLDLAPGGVAESPGCIGAALKKAVADAGLVCPPLICVGGMDAEDRAREAIEQGRTELVAIGRGLIADPHWCEKVRAGKQSEILRCIRCGMGCTKNITHRDAITCLRWDPKLHF